jgi:CBS domain containing-hemolysin-like protein/mannitol/fructose-specific phosphotransferase system IIA component (Ntr-type)
MPLLATLAGILLIGVNAFFAMAEYALVRIRPSRIEELARAGRRLAPLIRFASEHLNDYLSAVQLAITMTSLGLGWVAEPGVAALLGGILPLLPLRLSVAVSASISFTLAFLIITALHITFGELLPKLLAIRNPDRALTITIVPLTGMYYLSYGPMLLLNRTASGVARWLSPQRSPQEETHSEEEIRILLEQRQEAGGLSLQRLVMFENLFDFGRASVREVMTPRSSIAFLSASRSWDDNLAVMLQRRASRYLVCKNDLDTVVGYVHVKDLAFQDAAGGERPEVLQKVRPVLRVRESLALEECLRLFQERRSGIAVVTDSRRKVSGLLTTEDIVEEIVGEIRDEFERPPTVRLTDAFVPGASELDCRDRDLLTLLGKSVGRLHASHPVFDADVALNQVYTRERGLSSALGHGAAFPHARVARLDRALLGFTRCPEGLDLKAVDGKPVRIVFLILTPFQEPTSQLSILSRLARLVMNATLRDRLMDSTTSEEVVDVLRAFEHTVPA